MLVAPFSNCTGVEQRGVMHFCGQKMLEHQIYRRMLTKYGELSIARKVFVLQEEAHLHSAAATYCSSNQVAED